MAVVPLNNPIPQEIDMKNSQFWRSIFAIFFVVFFCPACSKQAGTTPLTLTGYNHTDAGIAWYSVEIPNGEGGGAGYLGAGNGGGGFTCCVSVPSKWRAGLVVTVTKVIVVDNVKKYVKRVVPIPPYDLGNASLFAVHFLRNGGVKVFVTGLSLGHRDYPLKGKEAELEKDVPIEIIWP
jgi:hypothetical protein